MRRAYGTPRTGTLTSACLDRRDWNHLASLPLGRLRSPLVSSKPLEASRRFVISVQWTAGKICEARKPLARVLRWVHALAPRCFSSFAKSSTVSSGLASRWNFICFAAEARRKTQRKFPVCLWCSRPKQDRDSRYQTHHEGAGLTDHRRGSFLRRRGFPLDAGYRSSDNT